VLAAKWQRLEYGGMGVMVDVETAVSRKPDQLSSFYALEMMVPL
jgi:hypothetical protein